MNTKVNIAGVELKNPVMTASGTFGFGEEYAAIEDLSLLGGIGGSGTNRVLAGHFIDLLSDSGEVRIIRVRRQVQRAFDSAAC